MEVKPIVAGGIVLAVAVVAYLLFKREGFTRTCLSADTNCRFVRSPVDYAFNSMTDIPQKMGMQFPHKIANIKDKLQPLSSGKIDLIKDESLLWHPDKLWKQYEHNWGGCGDNQMYIVNDDKTRFSLADVGDIWVHRILNSMPSPAHGPAGNDPALTEQDLIRPEPFQPHYGGYSYIPVQIGSR